MGGLFGGGPPAPQPAPAAPDPDTNSPLAKEAKMREMRRRRGGRRDTVLTSDSGASPGGDYSGGSLG